MSAWKSNKRLTIGQFKRAKSNYQGSTSALFSLFRPLKYCSPCDGGNRPSCHSRSVTAYGWMTTEDRSLRHILCLLSCDERCRSCSLAILAANGPCRHCNVARMGTTCTPSPSYRPCPPLLPPECRYTIDSQIARCKWPGHWSRWPRSWWFESSSSPFGGIHKLFSFEQLQRRFFSIQITDQFSKNLQNIVLSMM